MARQWRGNIGAIPNATPPHLSTILKCPQCVHHVGVLFVLVFGPMSEDNVTMCCKMHIDCVNVEAPRDTVVQSPLQWILACHCVMQLEQRYIQPNMFETFLERIIPMELQSNPRDALFYTILCKRFIKIQNKTTMACMGQLHAIQK